MSTTSSTNPNSSSHDAPARLNEGNAPKEVRAHEHARHRTRERREHALSKERKEKAAAVRVLGLKVAHGAKLARKLSMESWDGEEPEERERGHGAVSTTTTTTRSPSVTVAVQPRETSPRADAQQQSVPAFSVLTLGDLISRPRKPKAKQLDFEVIPPIRPVIALDDAEMEEPWEYVTRASLNDGSSWKGKSYAQVVVSAM